MKTVILKYNAGNIRSVVNALQRLGTTALVTDSPEELMSADRVIVPGQGEAANTMSYLSARGLDELIRQLKQPVLGICIGQQLFCESSAEGNTDCLGIFPKVRVEKFQRQQEQGIKVPHIGWNTIGNLRTPLFEGLPAESFVYYVHSYYVPVCPYTIATTEYGGTHYSAAMHKDNFYATQFHPEKSGAVGEQLLRNFLAMKI